MTLDSAVSPTLGLGNFRRSQVSVVHVINVRTYSFTILYYLTMSNHLQMFRAKAAHSPKSIKYNNNNDNDNDNDSDSESDSDSDSESDSDTYIHTYTLFPLELSE